jgi:hypothetical protein
MEEREVAAAIAARVGVTPGNGPAPDPVEVGR